MTFSRQSLRPLSPRAIRGAVGRFRKLAESIERHAEPATPQERRALTQSINGLAAAARDLSRRHRGATVAEELNR